MKLACMMQDRRKYEAKIVMKVSGSKAEMSKFHDVWNTGFLWLIYDSSNNVTYCDVCRKTGQDITGKTEFVTGKKKVLFFK